MVEENSYTFAVVIILGLVALFLVYWFVIRNNNKKKCKVDFEEQQTENFNNLEEEDNNLNDRELISSPAPDYPLDYPPETKRPMNGELVGDGVQSQYNNNSSVQQLRQAACFPKEMLTPEELKPQDNSSLWAQVNPAGEGSLKGRSFLQAGHNIGINTVGQTLRNSNLQLRSEPPCPQVSVSPWNQTTIEPDTARKPLEIGGCA
jgi:hypothetical protein